MSTNERKKEIVAGSNDSVAIIRKWSYSFADEGGAVGAITLDGADGNAEVIPNGSIITRSWTDVKTAMTSGGAATVALGYTGNDNAFKAATAYNDAAYTDVDAQTAEVPLKVTSDVSVLATVATAALTAGAFDVYVEYIPPAGKGLARS